MDCEPASSQKRAGQSTLMTYDSDQIKCPRIWAVTKSEMIRIRADLPQCNHVLEDRLTAASQRLQSHVQIRSQHRRRRECAEIAPASCSEGSESSQYGVSSVHAPTTSPGRKCFQRRCDCEQQQQRQQKKTRACCHHSHFRIASSHSVNFRDSILFIAFSHDGAEKMCTAKLHPHVTSP